MIRAPLLLLAALPVAACSPAVPAEDHAHHEHSEPKTDPHHVGEGRGDCEDDVALSREALERYGIEIAPARETLLAPTISAPGHLAFPQGAVARVGSAAAGRVVEIRVRSGAPVAKGDVLLVVESPDFGAAQSDYLQKRTLASAGGPALELARGAFERAHLLHERVQGVALAEVQRREAELRQAERDAELARSAATAAENRLVLAGMGESSIRELERTGRVEPRLPVVAPIEGRVVEVAVALGELVDPGKESLVVVGDLSTLWAVAEVSESRLAEIALGAPARVRVPAVEGAATEGRVAGVPVVLEASTRTAEVRIDMPNPGGALLPGMFLQVEIDSSRGGARPVLVVPDAAVLAIGGRSSVFVPVEPGSGVFCRHDVEVGTPARELVPVLAGLKAGDPVVVTGAFLLKAELGKRSAKHEH